MTDLSTESPDVSQHAFLIKWYNLMKSDADLQKHDNDMRAALSKHKKFVPSIE